MAWVLRQACKPWPARAVSSVLLLPALQVGLNYICATAERFFAVGAVLASMVTGLAEQVRVLSLCV